MTDAEIEAISFGVPDWRLPRIPSVAFKKDGVFGRSFFYFEPFYCTVFSTSRPPQNWQSEDDYPVDILVLHHSPRSLTHSPNYKNWRFWDSGDHIYTVQGGGCKRAWQPPPFWRESLSATYIHINVDIELKRGDVLCLSGHSIKPLCVNENFELSDDPFSQSTGVFGTDSCPWFYAQSVDVYTAWPESRISLADPTRSLRALPSPNPRQIVMQPIPDSYRLAAA